MRGILFNGASNSVSRLLRNLARNTIQSFVIVIVIANSRFLERPHKRSRRNQLIHRRLTKNKIDRHRLRYREPGRQACRQTVKRLWWMVFGVETERDVWGRR